jgi:hypothetical protein
MNHKAMQSNEPREAEATKHNVQNSYNDTNRTKVTHRRKLHESITNHTRRCRDKSGEGGEST